MYACINVLTKSIDFHVFYTYLGSINIMIMVMELRLRSSFIEMNTSEKNVMLSGLVERRVRSKVVFMKRVDTRVNVCLRNQ